MSLWAEESLNPINGHLGCQYCVIVKGNGVYIKSDISDRSIIYGIEMTTGAHVRRRLALRRRLAAVATPKHVQNHLCLIGL